MTESNRPLRIESNFFALRTPMLPIESFLDWGRGLGATSAAEHGPGPDLRDALARDRAALRTRLQEHLQDPVIREALFLASPDLDSSLGKWLAAPESDKGQRTELALVRYFSRMANRPTPFGLFAGCSVGDMGDASHLALHPRTSYARHSRPDMEFLLQLVQALAEVRSVRQSLRYRPNSSLYKVGRAYRYAEWRNGKDDEASLSREYHLVSVEYTDYLEDVLDAAEGGATLETLAAAITGEEVSTEEATDYVHSLIDSQVLVSNLEPSVTGSEPVTTLLQVLEGIEGQEATVRALRSLLRGLDRLDADGMGHAPASYHDLAAALEGLPVQVDRSKFLQVDMTKPADAKLSRAFIDKVEGYLNVLYRITPGTPHNDGLERFRAAFTERYETRWVPLTEALDEEGGIGWTLSDRGRTGTVDVLRDLDIGRIVGRSEQRWSQAEFILARKLATLGTDPGQPMVLSAQDIDALTSPDHQPFPDSAALTISIAATSAQAFQDGDYRLLMGGAFGPSGARILGRFCHGDPNLFRKVKEHLAQEEAFRPDVLFAEITHLPQGRVGNVIIRPLLRDFEITYLGVSGAPEANQIPISDLMVTVRHGKVVLKSARFDREVLPRMSNAHNFTTRSLTPYRFLNLLQGQGTQGAQWSWGRLGSEPFLPRVEYESAVFALARWNITEQEFKPVLEAQGDLRFLEVQRWRQQRRLPRIVNLCDGDNKLPVDLDNVLSIEAMVSIVKKRKTFSLEEDFPAMEETPVHGPEGRYAHEIVLPLTRAGSKPVARPGKPTGIRQADPPEVPPKAVARSFMPGDEWLYLKLYSGWSTADHMLFEAIRPAVEGFLASGAIDRWFFIRYQDPETHLRLRFQGKPEALYSTVLPGINQALAPYRNPGGLYKVQIDTYERELERYGGAEGICLAEKIFQADSEAVLHILEAYHGDAHAHARWMMAILGIDAYLGDFGLSLEERHAWLKKARDSFSWEFHMGGASSHRIGARYRTYRKELENLLLNGADKENPYHSGLLILQNRSRNVKKHADTYTNLYSKHKNNSDLYALIQSITHMFINRLLQVEQRQQEMLAYDFLARATESILARDRKK